MPHTIHRIAPFALATLFVSACCPCTQMTPSVSVVTPAPAISAPHVAPVVGPKAGDVLAITVEGEKDLSGDYTVGPEGKITMPLIGAVAVAGQPMSAIPGVIADAYRAGYLVDPKISVTEKRRPNE